MREVEPPQRPLRRSPPPEPLRGRGLPLFLAGLVLLTVTLGNGSNSSTIKLLALVVMTCAGLVVVAAARTSLPVLTRPLSAMTVAVAVGTLSVSGSLYIAIQTHSGNDALPGVLPLLVGVVVGAAVALERPTHIPNLSGIVVAIFISLGYVFFLRGFPPAIDVYVFLTDAARALLHGQNPYGLTFPNIYPPEYVAAVYGPGVVVDGRITYGFPYLPVTALTAVPGVLLGDVRISSVLALAVTAVLVLVSAPGVRNRAIGLALLTAPTVWVVVVGAWTETVSLALLAAALFLLTRRRLLAAAVVLGVLFVSKQYLVVAVPALWLLRDHLRRSHVAVLIGTGVVIVGSFFLWDPVSFWRAVVQWQLVQPFRSDSLSALVLAVNAFDWPPPWVYGVLPLAAGFGLALVLTLRLEPGPAAFSMTLGLSLLVTVLLSKQAFVNYYFLCGGALVLAGWVATACDPCFRGRRTTDYSQVRSRRSATDGETPGSSPRPSAR